MNDIRIKVIGGNGATLAVSHAIGDGVGIFFAAQYSTGDSILLNVPESGLYSVKLDEALPEATLYLDAGENIFPIPTGVERICYSPAAFTGSAHLLTMKYAPPEISATRRNLAFNPYDHHSVTGIFPHATANVETRNEAVFAARNAIDGIYENISHGVYPYSSWGINRDPNAELHLDFGRAVTIDAVRITLRADFPHDSFWEEGTLRFSDGSSEILNWKKSALPQESAIPKRTITRLTLGELIKAKDSSPFPALTQFEVFGTDITD